jgi:hypothetical protein
MPHLRTRLAGWFHSSKPGDTPIASEMFLLIQNASVSQPCPSYMTCNTNVVAFFRILKEGEAF